MEEAAEHFDSLVGITYSKTKSIFDYGETR